ncbi:alpha/beta hydrolase fold domain-containing protein [Novosphingobium sp. FSY-8]|uniref:Alpha/beta hydrolase fold domain-containing protein n=1 Tax=Novosphingobium ovatum TaxID=1908523 RepID=A0ABW9XCS7_9SPHN|nr:alpha/beta hydrolase [Novosphingobium ovatum]NBC36344.1 alpha/beta hydrolase fold domain-containing protein [Novosphingobium ovatum]
MSRKLSRAIGVALAAAMMAGAPAMQAQPVIGGQAGVRPMSPIVRVLPPVPVWNGTPDGPKDWPAAIPAGTPELWEHDGAWLFNVSVPTYTPYLPDPTKATGAAVIVAPGGGFRFLSMTSEGTQVAQWLAEHGIAAFVLKYRTTYRRPGEAIEAHRQRNQASFPNGLGGAAGAADGIEALRQIRARAAEYGIDPQRVGAVGFSAGGHVSGMMAIDPDPAKRANFSGLIYGMPFLWPLPPLPAANLPYPPGTPAEPWLRPAPTPAPGALPPIFMAGAQDDAIAGVGFTRFQTALAGAGYLPEVHLYQRGGHGFGMRQQNLTTDHWIEEFYWWIAANGFLSAKPAPTK